jgi:hypothetical protein
VADTAIQHTSRTSSRSITGSGTGGGAIDVLLRERPRLKDTSRRGLGKMLFGLTVAWI